MRQRSRIMPDMRWKYTPVVHLTLVAILLAGLGWPRAVHSAPAPPAIRVETDRPEAIYKVGEPVTFRITLTDDDAPLAGQTLAYRISKDGVGELAAGTITTAAQPVEVKASLDEPGFIRCEVTVESNDPSQPATQPSTQPSSPLVGVAAAAVDPTEIPPSLPPPVDFERFWKRQRALLEENPAQPVLTPVESPDPAIDVFDIRMDCPGGAPLSGYLAIPNDAKEKSLPAILHPHSAGVRSSDLNRAVRHAKLGGGAICLDFNAHGLPNGKPEEYYQSLRDTTLKDYRRFGAGDMEKIYFRGMLLRLMRAIEFVTARPQWDGKTLIVTGSSQGGGQALIAAGLDERISLCLASVPALCDHTGFAAQRISGWPKLVKLDESREPADGSSEVARYYDAMNFAARIKCPSVVTVGFIDRVCPPTSVYAAFNAIESEHKRIINRPDMAHTFPPDLQQVFASEIEKHVAMMKKAPPKEE